MLSSTDFEQLVARIHRTLEDSGSRVEWNEHVTDPIDEGGTRQVDVTIRRDGWVTFVECRLRKRPQEVGWIEQLQGRKETLGANSIIAVSSSGFSAKAIKYASHLGILLRDFSDLSESEVKEWGKPSVRSIVSFRYQPLTVQIAGPPIATLEQGISLTGIDGEPTSWHSILMPMSEKADRQVVGKILDFNGFIGPFFLNGKRIERARVIGRVQKQAQFRRVSQISVYSDPISGSPKSSIERFGDERTEFIRSPDHCSLVFDMSSVVLPKNSVFGSIVLDAGEPVMLTGYGIVGELAFVSKTFKIRVEFHA